jgi:hypothetical protein
MYVADVSLALAGGSAAQRWWVEAQRSAAQEGGSAAHSSNGPTGSSVFTMRIWPGKQNSNAACEMQP